MNRYAIKRINDSNGKSAYIIIAKHPGHKQFFAGYNFMGGAEWETDINGAYCIKTAEEAFQIASDLIASA